MIGRAAAPDGPAIVADMEAGLEHLAWAGGTLRHVDLLLIVVEPTAKSLATAARTHVLADELGIRDVAVVANRVPPDGGAPVERFADGRNLPVLAVLPEDPAVRHADQAGACLVDTSPDAPAARALTALADELSIRFAADGAAHGPRPHGDG